MSSSDLNQADFMAYMDVKLDRYKELFGPAFGRLKTLLKDQPTVVEKIADLSKDEFKVSDIYLEMYFDLANTIGLGGGLKARSTLSRFHGYIQSFKKIEEKKQKVYNHINKENFSTVRAISSSLGIPFDDVLFVIGMLENEKFVQHKVVNGTKFVYLLGISDDEFENLKFKWEINFPIKYSMKPKFIQPKKVPSPSR